MRTIVTLVFFMLLGSEALAKDSLWTKAIDISEKNKNYKAQNVVLYIDDLNKDGTVNSSQEIYQKLRAGKNIKYDTVKVLKDNKDITQEALKKQKEQKNRGSFLDENDIFSKKVQDKISSEKVGSQNISGTVCDIYSYKFDKNEKEKYEGKAWINNQTGTPVKVEYSMNPLPIGLKSLSIIYLYETQKNKTYIKNIKADGEASFLIFKKIFRMKADLKDFKEINGI